MYLLRFGGEVYELVIIDTYLEQCLAYRALNKCWILILSSRTWNILHLVQTFSSSLLFVTVIFFFLIQCFKINISTCIYSCRQGKGNICWFFMLGWICNYSLCSCSYLIGSRIFIFRSSFPYYWVPIYSSHAVPAVHHCLYLWWLVLAHGIASR